jgi:hypothetical protein
LVLASPEELAGGALVEALRQANEEILASLDAHGTEQQQRTQDELAVAYAQFVEEWSGKEDVDAHLVRSGISLMITNLLFIFFAPSHALTDTVWMI